MSSNNQPMDQTNDDNMPTHTKSINTNMPTSMININQPPTTTTTTKQQPTATQQYNLFPEQQQLYILQQELLKQETILSSFKNDNSPEHSSTANKEECLTTWQQTQVNEMNESINVIKRENEERKQKLFDIDSGSTMGGNSGSSNKEEVVLCGTANDSSASRNNRSNNNRSNNYHNNMTSVEQQQQQQFIPEPLKLPSKRQPISRRGGGKVSNNGGRLTQSLNNEQQQNYTSYEQRPYSSSFTYGQTPFEYGQQQQGYGYGGEDLATIGGMGDEMSGDTFGRPFHSIDQQQGYNNEIMSTNQHNKNRNKLFNGQVYMGEMEQYNINNESKMTRRNSIYKPNQQINTNMMSTNDDMVEEVVPTINFGNISKPKKRRLNSNNNEMLLAMLTDTIVSPGRGSSGDKDKVTLPPPPPMPTAGSIGTQNNGNGRRESTLSPPTNLDKVAIGDVNTPTMFANYFLSNIGIKECKEDGGGDVITTMPPPPLLVGNNNSGNDVQMKEESKKKKVNQTKERKLPAVVWQPSANTNSPKLTKTTIKDNNPKSSSYNETPSSEIIKALSNQIKSNLSSSLASSSSSLYQTATNTTTGGDEGSCTMAKTGATQPQFALSMEASQASQQSIHDWDKKFGLRRAHSKTMRESCRSRKRVLDFLKGEGSNLLLLKQQMMERTQQGKQDDTALPSLQTSTASTSTISLSLQRGVDSAVIESADVDINMQDQEVGMSYEVHEVESKEQPLQEQESVSNEELLQEEVQEQESVSLPRQTLLGSKSQAADDDQTDFKEILATNIQKTNSDVSSSSTSDGSKELEQMFRRASLDCTQVITGLTRPVQESDCKQYIAKSA